MPKKKHIPKSGPVWRRSAEEATLDKMPKYNAHACGTGPHGDAKYNRAKEKQAWKRELDRQGVRNRRPLLFRQSHRPMRSSSSPSPVTPSLRMRKLSVVAMNSRNALKLASWGPPSLKQCFCHASSLKRGFWITERPLLPCPVSAARFPITEAAELATPHH